MKRLAFLICLIGIFITAKSQNDSIRNSFGFGYQLNLIQSDFGMGIHVTSPYFAKKKLAVRLRGNLMFLDHLNNGGTHQWTPYSNVQLGFIGTGATISNFMRLYGEGGLMFLFPSGVFSTESVEIGGYGLFGFEFHLERGSSYFIELGGCGTGARADKVSDQPFYSNGFLIGTGFRHQF